MPYLKILPVISTLFVYVATGCSISKREHTQTSSHHSTVVYTDSAVITTPSPCDSPVMTTPSTEPQVITTPSTELQVITIPSPCDSPVMTTLSTEPQVMTSPSTEPQVITTPSTEPQVITTPSTEPQVITIPSTEPPGTKRKRKHGHQTEKTAYPVRKTRRNTRLPDWSKKMNAVKPLEE